MNVSELGEFPLIARLAAIAGTELPPADLIAGIGDDAAAWRVGDAVLLATTDTLVEGVHFLPEFAPWPDIGWKALAVNVSDIAAMGGEPLFALVTLALPPETDVAVPDDLYAGLMECAAEYGVTIAGGDIVRASEISITIALIGRSQTQDGKPLLMRRDAAKAGDLVAVTGSLGDSAAGLWRLRKGATAEDALVRAHLRPLPRLAEAHEAARLGVVCAIDVSDGLLQDLGHICERSGLGADVNEDFIPLSDDLRAAYPEDALALATSGGEDYELLITGGQETIHQVAETLSTNLTIIGRLTESTEHRPRLLDEAGNERPVAIRGWDHLHSA